jgi:acetyltransferase-like isoleucine patch superfamily enzyme
MKRKPRTATRRRTIPDDWFPGTIPANVLLDEQAYLETSYSFLLYRSKRQRGVAIAAGATVYLGTMFDLGPRAQVAIGKYALINGAWIISDAGVEIGDYALISWNVVLMDTYRIPTDTMGRRGELKELAFRERRRLDAPVASKKIRIESNVWIGFDCCVLPGVTIGEGSIIGARSVVADNVPPYSIYAGNPARLIRRIEKEKRHAEAGQR